MHGVAHGNISPACVLIEVGAPTSRGLVADVRRTAEMIQYHSPERFRNGQLSPLDDAWALAGTLFTMLTTARPFGELRPEIEARIYQGVPPLGAYGINDDQLYAIVAAALAPDPTRRTQSVTTFRLHLEHWANDPHIRELPALEDEEGGEDDQAATAMVAMESMVFEEPSTSTSRPASIADSGNLFAPPSFDPRSSEGAPRVPARPSRPEQPPPLAASPLGEQDATVMRELPAHIIAMAARAASGSSPPPPMEEQQPAPAFGGQQGFAQPQPGFAPPPQIEDEPDYGQATKIAPAPDMAAVLLQSRDPAPGPPPPPNRPPPMGTQQGMAPPGPPPHGGPPGPPGGPPSPRQIPRAFKQTQLGMGGAGAPPPGIPRPGFNPPPQPPGQQFQYQQQQQPQQAEAPAPDAADDDDGGRTVMRESPAISPDMFQNAAQAQWKPAPPPVQPRAFGGGTDRPPGQSPAGGAPLPLGPEPGGVSALIQETLGQPMPPLGQPSQQGGPPPGFPPPPGGGFEPTAGFPGPFQPTSGGPFQPVGMQQGYPGLPPGQQPFDLGPGQQPFDLGGQQLGNYGQGGGMLDQQSMDMQPPMPLDPGGYPRAPGQPTAKRRGSGAGLVVVCLLVLVLAAALTFLALKFRPQLGF